MVFGQRVWRVAEFRPTFFPWDPISPWGQKDHNRQVIAHTSSAVRTSLFHIWAADLCEEAVITHLVSFKTWCSLRRKDEQTILSVIPGQTNTPPCSVSYFDTRLTNRTLNTRVSWTTYFSFRTWLAAVSFSTLLLMGWKNTSVRMKVGNSLHKCVWTKLTFCPLCPFGPDGPGVSRQDTLWHCQSGRQAVSGHTEDLNHWGNIHLLSYLHIGQMFLWRQREAVRGAAPSRLHPRVCLRLRLTIVLMMRSMVWVCMMGLPALRSTAMKSLL